MTYKVEQERASMLLSMLPMSVQSRVTPINSLRQAVSLVYTRHRSRIGGLAETTVVEQQAVRVDASVDEKGPPAVQQRQHILDTSGIKWRYAMQGTKLHHTVYDEREDRNFSRKSYIDGVGYMLMGLPDDLNDKEVAVIRDALPQSCVAEGIPVRSRDGGLMVLRTQLGERTALQRCVAYMVASLIILLHWAISYATTMIRIGAQYERKHNVAQQLISKGCYIAAVVAKHSAVISNGRVGKAVGNLAAWAVESITCGIQDGLGQGLATVDTRPRQTELQ